MKVVKNLACTLAAVLLDYFMFFPTPFHMSLVLLSSFQIKDRYIFFGFVVKAILYMWQPFQADVVYPASMMQIFGNNHEAIAGIFMMFFVFDMILCFVFKDYNKKGYFDNKFLYYWFVICGLKVLYLFSVICLPEIYTLSLNPKGLGIGGYNLHTYLSTPFQYSIMTYIDKYKNYINIIGLIIYLPLLGVKIACWKQYLTANLPRAAIAIYPNKYLKGLWLLSGLSCFLFFYLNYIGYFVLSVISFMVFSSMFFLLGYLGFLLRLWKLGVLLWVMLQIRFRAFLDDKHWFVIYIFFVIFGLIETYLEPEGDDADDEEDDE